VLRPATWRKVRRLTLAPGGRSPLSCCVRSPVMCVRPCPVIRDRKSSRPLQSRVGDPIRQCHDLNTSAHARIPAAGRAHGRGYTPPKSRRPPSSPRRPFRCTASPCARATCLSRHIAPRRMCRASVSRSRQGDRRSLPPARQQLGKCLPQQVKFGQRIRTGMSSHFAAERPRPEHGS
jgi:hypothetical protein